ncbi:hypothetical protein CCR97_00155 [Rhodoplanes elegans]|uniref:Uncharacterized protein n=1 Tax=Rhodoplanes elegans TaxID=29408 RepID=A0A327KTF6_9BRAD|nr:hypothetical protein [Rhodoplanes elegans]RAI41306.1 hypothetical protein CH338_03505 [Rhodoplanes elegans]
MLLLARVPVEFNKKMHSIRGKTLQMLFESANFAVKFLSQKRVSVQVARDDIPAEVTGVLT